MTTASKKDSLEKVPVDQVSLTLEGKRRATIEKVSKDILERITRLGTQGQAGEQPVERAKKADEKKTGSNGSIDQKESTFVFNVIDAINQKHKNMVSVENSSFLIKRLEQLSSDAKDKKMESWV